MWKPSRRWRWSAGGPPRWRSARRGRGRGNLARPLYTEPSRGGPARAGRGAAGDHRLLDRRRGRVLPRDRRLRRVRLPDPRPGRPGGRSAGAAVVLHTPLSPAHSPWLEGIARVDSRAPNVDYVAANVLEVPPGRIQEALSGSNPGSPTEQTKVATPPDASDAGGPDRDLDLEPGRHRGNHRHRRLLRR